MSAAHGARRSVGGMHSIDLADPAAPYANEPGPNGGQANAGVVQRLIRESLEVE